MAKRSSLPLTIGGQYQAGDGGATPAGTSLAINNHLTRPSRYPARPPFVYDGVMSVNGLANFDDTASKVTRLVAVDTAHNLYVKAASGETWGAANSTPISGTRLTDAANYRGTSYLMFDDGAGLPIGAASFDGTNVSTSPFPSAVTSRTITTFDERLYFTYPRITFSTYLGGIAPHNSDAYGQAAWTKTNCTVETLVNGATTTIRLTTTSAAANAVYLRADSKFAVQMPSTSAISNGLFTMFIRPVSALGVDTPLSVALVAKNDVQRSTAYVVGFYIVDGGFLQECTTAGTSAIGAPAFNATVGGTTTDGTVTWTNRGLATVGFSGDLFVVDGSDWMRVDVPWTLPAQTGSILAVNPQVSFFNISTPTLSVLGSYDLAYKDGLADGDIRKANYGWQFTVGDYYYPFHNSESSSVRTATTDLNEVVWSEIGLPNVIRASNTYKLREATGFPTAATTIGGRLMVGKRSAIWQFQDTGDPDIPIRREKFMAGIGVVGSLAHDKYEDDWFFIGDSEVYRYNTSDNIPKAICGDGMREVVMSKGADWVESQSTYKRPLLAVDQSRLIVWVYTQKGKLFAYDLRSALWSTHYVSNGAEIDAMRWNPNTGNLYVSFGGFGLARMDYTASANDTIDNTASTFAGDMSIVFHPIETPTGERVDATFEELRVMYAATGSQSGQTVTFSTSFDQGATYAHTVSCTPSVVSTAGNYLQLSLPVWQTASSVTGKLARLGRLGESSWSLSPRVEAMVNARRGEYIQANPTAGSVT